MWRLGRRRKLHRKPYFATIKKFDKLEAMLMDSEAEKAVIELPDEKQKVAIRKTFPESWIFDAFE